MPVPDTTANEIMKAMGELHAINPDHPLLRVFDNEKQFDAFVARFGKKNATLEERRRISFMANAFIRYHAALQGAVERARKRRFIPPPQQEEPRIFH